MTRADLTLTFTGGLRTPSGTRFLVKAGGSRALFDLGMAFTPATSFFDGRVEMRPDRMLTDLLALGLAPPLPGLYAPAALGGDSGVAPGPDAHTAVFVTHLHLDHMSLLAFVADEIPVYMSADGAALVPRLESAGHGSGLTRRVQALAAGETVTVGELKVTLLPVDHDVPGAAAFLIDTPDGTLVYSGDLRTHGFRPHETEAFVRAVAARHPRALVIETTRLGEEPGPALSEREVIDGLIQAAREATGLVIVVPYPRNLERLARLTEVAGQAGRKLVVEPSLVPLLGSRLPSDTAVYGADGSDREQIDAGALKAEASRYLLQLSYRRLAALVDLQPPAGSLLLHSDGEPLGPFDPAHANLLRWLERFGIQYRAVRSSGHARPAELVRIAAAIQPDVIFPLHGFRPDLLLLPGVRQVLPVLDVPYRVDGTPA